MSLVRSQVPIHSATGAQCGDPGRIQTPVARVAPACLVSRPRSLDLVAPGEIRTPNGRKLSPLPLPVGLRSYVTTWSDRRESNPHPKLGRLACCP